MPERKPLFRQNPNIKIRKPKKQIRISNDKMTRKFSISCGRLCFLTNHWIPAFAGMTDNYTQSSFPWRRESIPINIGITRTY